MIITFLIDRITISGGYQVHVVFGLTAKQYQHIMTVKRKEVADTVNQHMNSKFEILTQQNPEQ